MQPPSTAAAAVTWASRATHQRSVTDFHWVTCKLLHFFPLSSTRCICSSLPSISSSESLITIPHTEAWVWAGCGSHSSHSTEDALKSTLTPSSGINVGLCEILQEELGTVSRGAPVVGGIWARSPRTNKVSQVEGGPHRQNLRESENSKGEKDYQIYYLSVLDFVACGLVFVTYRLCLLHLLLCSWLTPFIGVFPCFSPVFL